MKRTKRWMLVCSIVVATCGRTNAGVDGQLASKSDHPVDIQESLEDFLRHYLVSLSLDEDKATTYAVASVDLNEDGEQENVVYVSG
ncbi:MAG TPA: hypothetical protein VF442_04750, partial [Sphingobium sp.]